MKGPHILSAVVSMTLVFTSAIWAQRQESSPASTSAASPGTIKGDPAKGKTRFRDYGCDSCHSGEGQGSFAGPRLGPNPMPFPQFVRYVRAPRGVMPPYTEKLLDSEQDLADIHAYLSTRPKPAPVSALEQLAR